MYAAPVGTFDRGTGRGSAASDLAGRAAMRAAALLAEPFGARGPLTPCGFSAGLAFFSAFSPPRLLGAFGFSALTAFSSAPFPVTSFLALSSSVSFFSAAALAATFFSACRCAKSKSMNSRIAISAPSPGRRPSLRMRV